MENQALQELLGFSGSDLRVAFVDGETWFVLKDVCDILEIENSRDVAKRLDDDEKRLEKIYTLLGKKEVTT